MRLETKRQKEVIDVMIRLYCKKHHQQPCIACESLKQYAYMRIDKCPFMETKSFKVHCYKQDMREEMKRVMCYSGTWMLFDHPVLAIRQILLSYKEKT